MGVKMPHDNMTKKEREALNGECKTYKPYGLLTFDEYKAMPDDLQKEHLLFIHSLHGATLRDMWRMWGAFNIGTVCMEFNMHDVKISAESEERAKKWKDYLKTQGVNVKQVASGESKVDEKKAGETDREPEGGLSKARIDALMEGDSPQSYRYTVKVNGYCLGRYLTFASAIGVIRDHISVTPTCLLQEYSLEQEEYMGVAQ